MGGRSRLGGWRLSFLLRPFWPAAGADPVKNAIIEICTVFFGENRRKDCAFSEKLEFDRQMFSEKPEKTVQNQEKAELTGCVVEAEAS